jgi:fatty-acyl-CoA synthase
MIVTQFTDAFDVDASGDDAPAPAWKDWLTTRHPLPALDGGKVIAWTDALEAGHPPPEHVVGANDMALLPYTSGTTGLPKGCIHHQSSLMHNAVSGQMWGGSTSETVVLAVVPMFHITGVVSMMHTAILAAATLIIMPRWDRDVAGRLISRWKVTAWTNIPTMVIDLMASPNFASYDLSSMTYIGGGGAAMPQAVAQRLFEQYGLKYQEGYGLTETAAPSHTNPSDHPKQQCLGIPFMSTDARVVDPDTLKEMPIGESGEIIIHGPEVFQGYWKRPDATAAAFVEFEGKRFFRSGDVGPAEVELLMVRHPAIQEACVISTKDDYRGESVKAVVVLRATHKDTTEQQIIDWCRENMAVYKIPRKVQFVDALPKSGSGKVMWRLLQEDENAAK